MRLKRKRLLILAVFSLALFIYAFLNVRFTIKGHFEGFYLLHDRGAHKYVFADHLFVGEGKSLIYGKDFTPLQQSLVSTFMPSHSDNQPHLHSEWNPHDGSGMVSQYFSNGTQLVTYFGRYLDNEQEVQGLFIGGGLPDTVAANGNYNMNNSGMTFGTGKRWYHIWCSVNEGIGPINSQQMLTPAQWKFLGSKMIRSDRRVVITSSHSVIIDNLPVKIDRRVSFTAGDTYFNLEIKITNQGSAPLNYAYNYGDEPWVGYYGTSLGDVGWVKDRLIDYEEVVNSAKYNYAGIVDSGNRVIGEQPVYTNLANFIEWFGDERPFVYFANKGGKPPLPGAKKTPLESNERFIGLEWARLLPPGGVSTMQLAIGMADFDKKTGLPLKPATRWN